MASAFARKHKKTQKWGVDWTDPTSRKRHFTMTGDGLDEKAARAEAKAVKQRLKQQEITAGRQSAERRENTAAVLEQWLKEKQAEISPAAWTRYTTYVNHWKRHFVERLGVVRFYMLTRDHIVSYRNVRLAQLQGGRSLDKLGMTEFTDETLLRAAPGARSTVCGEMTALRAMWRWAVDQDYHHKDLAHRVKKPPLPRRLPRPFSRENQKKILEAAYPDKRRYLMFCLGIHAGLRRGGVVNLPTANVDLTAEMLRVTEKGEKDRLVPIVPALKQAFQECPPVDAQHWFGTMENRADEQIGAELCAFIRRVTGLKGDAAEFHCCRHSFGTNYLEDNPGETAIRELQELMGHASITTTMMYAQLVNHATRRGMGHLKPAWEPAVILPANYGEPQAGTPVPPMASEDSQTLAVPTR